MNKLIEIKFGSHLYGTDTENSDLDFKGIYLPTAKEICLGTYKKTICSSRPKQIGERNTKDDIDVEFFSLDRFMQLLCEGQTVALDMLFSPEFCKADMTITGFSLYIRNIIWLNKDKFINKNTNAFVGYTKQQAAKYGVKGFRVAALKLVFDFLFNSRFNWEIDEQYLPKRLEDIPNLYKQVLKWNNPYIRIIKDANTFQEFLEINGKKLSVQMKIKDAEAYCMQWYGAYGHRAIQAQNNEGIDWKALSHAVRIASEACELLETGFITFPRPDRELLIKIKTGQMPYDEVSEIIEQGLENIKAASKKSTLRDAPDKEWCDEFVFNIYRDIVRN